MYNFLVLYLLNGFYLPVHYYLLKKLHACNLNQFSKINVMFLNMSVNIILKQLFENYLNVEDVFDFGILKEEQA